MPMLGSVIWYGWPLPSALEVPFGAISAYERSVSAFPLSSDSTGCFSMSVTEPTTSYQARTDIGSSPASLSNLLNRCRRPDSGGWKGEILFWLPRAGGRRTGPSKGPAPPFVAVAGQASEACPTWLRLTEGAPETKSYRVLNRLELRRGAFARYGRRCLNLSPCPPPLASW